VRNARQPSSRSPRLIELARDVGALQVLNPADPVVPALTDDSREVQPGAVFVAVRGRAANGHDYIPQAVEQGAGAVVCEELPAPLPHCPVIRVLDSRYALSALAHAFYGHPSSMLRVTGITGTDGKTSTVEILREILREAGREAGSIGTLGYCFDSRRFDSDLTTPNPVHLHRELARMWVAGLTDVCMEASSQALVQHRVAHVDFDVAILTNITKDHLDTHGTRQNYAAAKRILFQNLRKDAVAILPARGEFNEFFMEACAGPILTYGLGDDGDVNGSILSRGMEGMEISVRTPFETYRVRTTLTGDYNCLNILAAATAALACGIQGEAVAAALRGFRGVPGRMETIRVDGRTDLPAVCVDFAHTPDALRKVLTALRPLVKGSLVCLIGCGGDRDPTKRPEMARIATQCADVAVFTADNSRSENTEDIIAEMVAGVDGGPARYHVEPDRRRAMKLALELAPAPDCLVALCGRGCEKYLKIGGQSIPFDDRTVARQLMSSAPLRRQPSTERT
jgi:UDP-N-acetylmuramoyl-L-alanyl-D-glutamate--2,6-diaminopimelate ligase